MALPTQFCQIWIFLHDIHLTGSNVRNQVKLNLFFYRSKMKLDIFQLYLWFLLFLDRRKHFCNLVIAKESVSIDEIFYLFRILPHFHLMNHLQWFQLLYKFSNFFFFLVFLLISILKLKKSIYNFLLLLAPILTFQNDNFLQ